MIEPLGAKWPPKAAKEDPKVDTERFKVAKACQMSTTRRPTAKNHERNSPKHGSQQRRTLKKQCFPQLFVCR